MIDVIKYLKELPHVEPHEDYLNAHNCYPYLNSLVRSLTWGKLPTTLLEVGVRFGYSAVAMALENRIYRYVGIDNNSYVPESLSKAKENLLHLQRDQPIDFLLVERSSQSLDNLEFVALDHVGLVHVDADHTYEGALHDMQLLWGVLAVGGHMLVDDTTYLPPVYSAFRHFVDMLGEPYFEVATFRGTGIILKTKARFNFVDSNA